MSSTSTFIIRTVIKWSIKSSLFLTLVSADCFEGKPITIQVDGNGELHPIAYNFNQINIGIAPNGNKDVVTHREVSACPTTSVATATTSSAPASTAVTKCELAENPQLIYGSCYLPWVDNHTPIARSGNSS